MCLFWYHSYVHVHLNTTERISDVEGSNILMQEREEEEVYYS